jgi:hypothetical protein
MAEGEVNVPAVGKLDRKWVIAGGALVVGVVGYAYWARSRAAAEPLPGEGEAFGGEQWSPDAYTGADAPGGSTIEPVEGAAPLTNADWSQRVIDLMEGAGIDRTFAAQTIGKYLAGNPLTTAEKLAIQTAIALLGYPPSGPIPITSAPEATVPTPATTLAAPGGLSARRRSDGRYVLTWSRVTGADGYQVRWIVRHVGGAVRTLGPNTFTYLTARAPTRGYLAFEVRSMLGTKRSAWRRTVVRTK